MTEARIEANKQNEMERQELLQRIIEKEENAQKVKEKVLKQQREIFYMEQSKTMKVNQNKSLIRQMTANSMRNIIKDMEDKEQQAKILKLKKRRIESIKNRVADEIRQNKIIKVDNPYDIFEQRKIQTAQGKRHTCNLSLY